MKLSYVCMNITYLAKVDEVDAAVPSINILHAYERHLPEQIELMESKRFCLDQIILIYFVRQLSFIQISV